MNKDQEYMVEMEQNLNKMITREEIISKQYKHYKELYISKETLTVELEGVIADLTNQIEQEKRKKAIED